jgi:hypothetical protein
MNLPLQMGAVLRGPRAQFKLRGMNFGWALRPSGGCATIGCENPSQPGKCCCDCNGQLTLPLCGCNSCVCSQNPITLAISATCGETITGTCKDNS